ncbi:DUF72 domain-containing protein [Chloroflexota bacterium]
MIYSSTSRFSCNDWARNFYPAGMTKLEWLTYYARESNTREVNSTFCALARPFSLATTVEKTGEGFRSSIKVNKEMIHQQEDKAGIYEYLCQVLEPIVTAVKLSCILTPFTCRFGFNFRNWNYLGLSGEWLGAPPLVIEFRNVQWQRSEVFDWLHRQDLGFYCVDESQLSNLLPPLVESTSKISYVRFHGRNRAKWWQHKQVYERHDYSYTSEELSEWLPKIQKLVGSIAGNTFIFANNHWCGQAVNTIRKLRIMLN